MRLNALMKAIGCLKLEDGVCKSQKHECNSVGGDSCKLLLSLAFPYIHFEPNQ